MDKGLVIVTVSCIVLLAFFVGYQLSIGDLLNDGTTDGGDDWDTSIVVDLTLKGNSIEVSHYEPVTVEGSRATILFGGTYKITGSLTDGQIAVYTDDEDPVRLILNGVNINCSTGAAISIIDAEEAFIILADGTENFVEDAVTYVYADSSEDEPNAAIFCKSDLTILGNGVLNVFGNYNDGIASKDGLVIVNGTINVRSVDDGIRGRDYIIVKSGIIDLGVGGDGLKSDNPENTTLGNISIENGTINIVSGGDALQAEKSVLITGGSFNLLSGGASSSVVASNVSSKGIKGLVNVTINGGVFEIDSADDAIHSNGTITLKSGSFTLSSGDDAIHADGSVEINGGEINVTKSFEGIESAIVTINYGDLHIVSADDGIDAVLNDGNPNSGVISIVNGIVDITSGGDAIQAERDVAIANGNFALTSGGGSRKTLGAGTSAKGIKGVSSVKIEGGIYTINSADDAVHSNGAITVNSGSLAISSGDDAIHADGSVEINGGDINVATSAEGIEGAIVTINGGDISITSTDDGLDAVASAGNSNTGVMSISNGVIDIRSSGDAIQAENSVLITGGTFTINSADDAIHSNGAITINGGSLAISTGDDGIHAEESITINNGEIDITKSYEGIEAPVITINNGNIHVVSSDDGVNMGVDSRIIPRPNPPGMRFSLYSGSYYLYINGGYLFVDALGDGIDSNGAVVMNAGVVIVQGPSSNMNSALDHVAFNITAGYLVAAGSSGMALPLGDLSEQYSVMMNFETANQEGTLISVRTSDGTEVFTFRPSRQYQSVIFSMPSLSLGSTYDVYVGGSHTGTVKDNLYSGGTYTPGTKYTSFTISTKVTRIGPSGGFLPRR